MKKYLNFVYIFLFTISFFPCKSCDKESSDSLLKHEYETIFCILAPDSGNSFVRSYPTEVFVGKIIPTNINNNFVVEGMQDTILKELMVCTRQHYIAFYDYDPNAEVYIEGNNQKIKLTYINKGIYRDDNNELKVKSNLMYKLSVKKSNGRTYLSETTIPDDIEIVNINTDTLSFIPIDNRKAVFNVDVSYSIKPFYLIERDKRNNMESDIIIYSFDSSFTKAVIFYKSMSDTTHVEFVDIKDEIMAVNVHYGQFFEPCGTIGVTENFWNWSKEQVKKNIKERSNIQGDDIVGVFGAYNATIKNYVVRALWDSVTKK